MQDDDEEGPPLQGLRVQACKDDGFSWKNLRRGLDGDGVLVLLVPVMDDVPGCWIRSLYFDDAIKAEDVSSS